MRRFALTIIISGLLCHVLNIEARAQECGPAFTDRCFPSPPSRDHSYLTPYAQGATTVYLNFDGAFIFKVNASDAHANLSFLCGGLLPPFEHNKFGDSRQMVRRLITTKLALLFADFNLKVVTRRPVAPPYDMVVITGDASICEYPSELAGIGPIDCFNQLPGEVAFVFAELITNLDLLVTVMAHEIGHSYGLLHSSAPCDIMSNAICQKGNKTFLDLEMELTPDHQGFCGLQQTNSWQMLMAVLGPRPGMIDSGPGPIDSGPAPAADAAQEAALDGGVPPLTQPPPASYPAAGCAAAPWDTSQQKEELELSVSLRVILSHLLLLMLLSTLLTVHRRTRGD